MTSWSQYDCLHPHIIQALTKHNLERPTHIQSEVFECYPHYYDFLVAAQTGSGKTLAFGSPILSELQKLKDRLAAPRLPQVLLGLILTPTRELAQQIQKNIGWALEKVNADKKPIDQLKVTCIIGGMSKEKQLRVLSQYKPHIVIGTPGRLHELLGEEALNFNHLKYLVIDEADRMIEMGHFKEIDEILESIFQPKTKEFFDKDFEEASRMMDSKTKGAQQEFYIKENGKKVKLKMNLNAIASDQLFQVPSSLFVFEEKQPKINDKQNFEAKQLGNAKESSQIVLSKQDQQFLSKLRRRIFFVSATLTRQFKGTKYFIKKARTEEEWNEKRKDRKQNRKQRERQHNKKDQKDSKQEKDGQKQIQQAIPKLKALLSRAQFSEKPKIIDQSSLLFMPQGLKQVVTFTQGENERVTQVINYLQELPMGSKIIIFANTIKTCKRIQFFVQSFGMETVSLHSHMQQKQRLKKLQKFKKSTLCNILIATDVAARGLDFHITHVIQMGVPVNGDTYVHRAGRTARANRTGQALIVVDKKQANRWTQINDIIAETAPNRQVAKYHPTEVRFNEIMAKVEDFDWIRRNQEKATGRISKQDQMDAQQLGVAVEEEAPRKKYDLDHEEEAMVRHQVKKRVETIKRANKSQKKTTEVQSQNKWRKNRLVMSLDQIKRML